MLNAQNVEVWVSPKSDFLSGDTCSLGQWTIQNLLKDISTNIDSFADISETIENLQIQYTPEFDVYCKCASINYGLLLVFIYGNSIIDIESHYKMSAMLSYKTSTSECELAELPYWRFQNFGVYIEEILKQENGGGSAGGESEQMQEMQSNIQSSTKGMMSNMKSSIGSFKAPKLK